MRMHTHSSTFICGTFWKRLLLVSNPALSTHIKIQSGTQFTVTYYQSISGDHYTDTVGFGAVWLFGVVFKRLLDAHTPWQSAWFESQLYSRSSFYQQVGTQGGNAWSQVPGRPALSWPCLALAWRIAGCWEPAAEKLLYVCLCPFTSQKYLIKKLLKMLALAIPIVWLKIITTLFYMVLQLLETYQTKMNF